MRAISRPDQTLPTRRDPEIRLPTPEQEQTLSSLKLQLAEFEQQLLTDTGSPERSSRSDKRSIDLQLKEVQKQVRQTMVTVALAEPRTTRILPRGDWMDKVDT